MKMNGSIDASLCQEVIPISILHTVDAGTKFLCVFSVVNSENTLDIKAGIVPVPQPTTLSPLR